MTKQTIYDELGDYMANCGQDAGEWALADMAAELDADGISTIDDMDPDDFTDFLAKWDGKVTDIYGRPIDFEAAMHLADAEICEALNGRQWSSNQAYIEAYAEEHAKKYGGEEFAPYYGHAW